MKRIRVYEADDGSRWDSQEKAIERDNLIREIDAIMAPIPKVKDKNCNFANGHGYVQRDPIVVAQVKAALLEPTRRVLKWWFDQQKKDHGKEPTDCHPSWYCRIMDGSNAPLDRAWSRICCIDDRDREWGQQYYANNPDKGEQIEWTGK